MGKESVNEFNEIEVLIQLKAGNAEAFALIYDHYKYKITNNLLRLLRSEELAEEVLQELFVKIWDTRQQLDPEKSFRAYLFRIAENMVIDYYRKAARDKKVRDKLTGTGSELYSHIEETIFSRESALILQGAIDLLPPQRKHVFTLCKLEGRSYKEVSEMLGISHSTINDHLLKANKFLKQHLNSGSGTVTTVLVGAILMGI